MAGHDGPAARSAWPGSAWAWLCRTLGHPPCHRGALGPRGKRGARGARGGEAGRAPLRRECRNGAGAPHRLRLAPCPDCAALGPGRGRAVGQGPVPPPRCRVKPVRPVAGEGGGGSGQAPSESPSESPHPRPQESLSPRPRSPRSLGDWAVRSFAPSRR